MTSPYELEQRFRAAVVAASPPAVRGDPAAALRPGSALTGTAAMRVFQAQLASRHLDLAARWLRERGEGYYTIGSCGHEGNAALAAALRPTDPALLHYRSGGFYCARAAQADPGAGGLTGAIGDVLRGLVASAREPIAGGRHKVFGNATLSVVPTTSTIASHLPRAVGLAFALERGARIGCPAVIGPATVPDDAIVVCSFGDASINHASAAAAFNTAGWCDHRGMRLPLLLVCEDNGIGVSVRSPAGWVATALSAKPGLRYFSADGCDLAATYDAARHAAGWVRRRRRPAVLHLGVVRLLGHAGADAEIAYRTAGEIAADLGRDPVARSAQLLVESGLADPDDVLAWYDRMGAQVRAAAEQVLGEPKLTDAAAVVAPLAPRRPSLIARSVAEVAAMAASRPGPLGARERAFGGRLPEHAGPLTLAQSINAALTDAMVCWPQAMLFGEDVAVKGGVYGVTKGVRERFGASRVFDTLLDETSILGLALGAGLAGLLPIAEIQYLAYLHNAEDQLRGEAATMSFFSRGAYRNPLVLRIAGLPYQEGFGGHFHNDNAVGVLRDIPGLVLACPARPDDAAAMLRTCCAAAVIDGSVCAYLEPIALYHTRDLHAAADGGWLARYDGPHRWTQTHVPIGQARVDVIGTGADLTIVTFGNGVRMSLQVAQGLAGEGVGCRVVDLRWLSPLPAADINREAALTGRVLVVDETRSSGGVSEGVLAALSDGGYSGAVRRVTSVDSFIPLGPAATAVLVTPEAIVQGAHLLLPR